MAFESIDSIATRQIQIGNNQTNLSSANLIIQNRSSGDAVIQFNLDPASNSVWMGMDNSASDNFVITYGNITTVTNLTSGTGITMDANQRVGMGGAPVSDAVLAVNSTSRSFLLPRMTESQMVAISNPTSGAMVFNSSSAAFMVFGTGGGVWKTITAT